MSSSILGRVGRPLAALAVVAAMFMGFSVASAAASVEVTVEPGSVDTTVFPEPVEITITGHGFGEYNAKDIRVGVCQTPPIEFVPPCGAFASNTTIDESGELHATIELESATIANDHFGVTPGQPKSFTCGESNCDVVVSYHPEGGGQTVLDSVALPFTP